MQEPMSEYVSDYHAGLGWLVVIAGFAILYAIVKLLKGSDE